MFLRLVCASCALGCLAIWSAAAFVAFAPAPPPIGKTFNAPPVETKTIEPPQKSLTYFHNAAVFAFGQTPGFGKGRLLPMRHLVENIFVHWSPGELDNDEPPIELPELAVSHRRSIEVLAGDPQNVPWPAMQVTSLHLDRPTSQWRLSSVDLIALVQHDEPIVYITSSLPVPRTEQEHGIRQKGDKADYTRGLDYFEMAGLQKLAKGEEMFVRTKDDALRVVGALRATTQCLECHAGSKEGDLFGAFTYTLKKVER